MLADDDLVLGKINTEGLVVSDVALNPLDVGTELVQRLIRLGGSARSCSRSKVPTFGISLSITNLRNAMAISRKTVSTRLIKLRPVWAECNSTFSNRQTTDMRGAAQLPGTTSARSVEADFFARP